MIIKKEWHKGVRGYYNYKKYIGWFLFGLIPLYIIISEG
jgi:hypothetical protein